jgi:hypothetical protein
MRLRPHPIVSVGFAVVLATAAFIPFAPAAGAANNCSSPGGISQFPNTPAGQSNLQVSCVLTTATAGTSQFYNTEDFPQAVWHVGAGRIVTGSTTCPSTPCSKTITLTAGTFTSADLNHGISGYSASTPLDVSLAGSNLPAGVFIVAVPSATTATLNLPATAAGTGKRWTVENSDSRAVADGHLTAASTTVTSATAHFCKSGLAGCGTNSDVGRAISGTDLQHATTISAVTSTTQITLSKTASASSTTEGLTIGPASNQTTARFVHDVHTTSASTTVTSASASFQSWDRNLPVVGTNIPAGARIVTVTNATTVVLSAAATAATTTGSLTIGSPSATAPKNGDTALNLGAELDLSPNLVAGSDPCTANTPEGFSITGAWQNPGSYASVAPFGSSTDASLKRPTIAQFAVPTAVVTFAGYVEQMPGFSGDTTAQPHYDLIFPFLPTGIAVCQTGTAGVASTFEFIAVPHSQSGLPTGIGTPNTAQARALKDITTASVSSSAVVHIRTNSASTSDNFTFTGACTETFPDVANFGCGIS